MFLLEGGWFDFGGGGEITNKVTIHMEIREKGKWTIHPLNLRYTAIELVILTIHMSML